MQSLNEEAWNLNNDNEMKNGENSEIEDYLDDETSDDFEDSEEITYL